MFGAELETTMNSRQRRKATRHMELERAALVTGMHSIATKGNEMAQALGKLGAAMKAVKRPVPNAELCGGPSGPSERAPG